MANIFSKAFFYIFIGLAAIVYYLILSPSLQYQHWDSLDYAWSAENRGYSSVMPNHPLGHLIHISFYQAIVFLGYEGRALPIFKALNAFISGAGIAMFAFATHRLLSVSKLQSASLGLILGSSYVMWRYTGTADIYSVAILTSILTWVFALWTAQSQSNHYWLGAAFGASILSHQFNVLNGLAIFIIIAGQKDAISAFTKISIASAIAIILGYVVSGYAAINSINPLDILRWAQGYFGNKNYGHYFGLDSLKPAIETAQNSLIHEQNWTGISVITRNLIFLCLYLFFPLTITARFNELSKMSRVVFLVGIFQSIVSWAFVLWWEPNNMKFWLLPMVPWLFALAAGASTVKKPISHRHAILLKAIRMALPPLAVILFAFNTYYGALPERKNSDTFNTTISAWLNNTHGNDLIIIERGVNPHLRFWHDRQNTVHLYNTLEKGSATNRFSELHSLITQQLCSGGRVIIESGATTKISNYDYGLLKLSPETVSNYLASYKQTKLIEQTIANGEKINAYQLHMNQACSSGLSAHP